METLSLLKYWHGAAAAASAPIVTATATAAAISAAAVETDENHNDDEEDDEGSFFDLEFAVPADEDAVDRESSAAESDDEAEGEFNFDVSGEGPRSGALSPSDDIFFKGGKLVQLEPSSVVIAPSESDPKPQLPISLLKSATKLRVFMLGLRKSRSAAADEPDGGAAAPAATSPKHQGPSKFFVRFKVEEVPIVSLFTRDNSSRVSASKEAKPAEDAAAEETRFAKEAVKRYLSKIKPLYVRVSKRYTEKLRFATHPRSGGSAAAAAARIVAGGEGDETDGEAEGAGPAPPPHTALVACGVKGPRASVPAGLRVVCKRLGKSRSASAAAEAAPPQPQPQQPPPPQQRRRDDSLLQQQDGIQSAIAHCKRSLNSARGIITHRAAVPVSTP
ncbi:putative membrane-associated kinase regulator 2 [Ananas comosus]|uniref:Putative membrane-associated kinase regulator 2 n=1 Tax=Ananas comosus TaxID=4615 RepID=A0A199VUF3_ANACO|nr:putative membrane-associated kinase regulator 2 [Ananas comosus]